MSNIKCLSLETYGHFELYFSDSHTWVQRHNYIQIRVEIFKESYDWRVCSGKIKKEINLSLKTLGNPLLI